MSPLLHVPVNANWASCWFIGIVDGCFFMQPRVRSIPFRKGIWAMGSKGCNCWSRAGEVQQVGCVGYVRSPSALQTLPGPNHGRESSGCSGRLRRERRGFCQPKADYPWDLNSTGCPRDVRAYNQVLNRWRLTFPFPVPAALLPVTWRQPWTAARFLIATGCQTSKPELPSLSLIILADILVAFSSQELPSGVVLVIFPCGG